MYAILPELAGRMSFTTSTSKLPPAGPPEPPSRGSSQQSLTVPSEPPLLPARSPKLSRVAEKSSISDFGSTPTSPTEATVDVSLMTPKERKVHEKKLKEDAKKAEKAQKEALKLREKEEKLLMKTQKAEAERQRKLEKKQSKN